METVAPRTRQAFRLPGAEQLIFEADLDARLAVGARSIDRINGFIGGQIGEERVTRRPIRGRGRRLRRLCGKLLPCRPRFGEMGSRGRGPQGKGGLPGAPGGNRKRGGVEGLAVGRGETIACPLKAAGRYGQIVRQPRRPLQPDRLRPARALDPGLDAIRQRKCLWLAAFVKQAQIDEDRAGLIALADITNQDVHTWSGLRRGAKGKEGG